MVVPMYDQIVVDFEKIENEEVLKSGLVLLKDEWSKQYNEGKVLAVGEGYKIDGGLIRPLKVKVGDTVLLRKATEVQYEEEDGKKYFITSEANVLAIR